MSQGALARELQRLAETRDPDKLRSLKDAIISASCGGCDADLNKMDNWREHSKTFQEEVGTKYKTLLGFLSAITRKSLIAPLIGKILGYRIMMGQVCEVVMIDSEKASAFVTLSSEGGQFAIWVELVLGSGSLATVFSESDRVIAEAGFTLIPYFLEDNFDREMESKMFSKTINEAASDLMDPIVIMGSILRGKAHRITVRLPVLRRINRKFGCRRNQDNTIRAYQGLAVEVCKKACQKAAEVGIGIPGCYEKQYRISQH